MAQATAPILDSTFFGPEGSGRRWPFLRAKRTSRLSVRTSQFDPGRVKTVEGLRALLLPDTLREVSYVSRRELGGSHANISPA
jgi:hypothetical protein